ncbi:hypothetical protein SLAV_01075 [Streptomyces lavendulae subsp. lavendulae]|uniref:Uncharacterized protein n=1 Tax=Streptomyces lavendulae subsp. lavendulae TaxID=58340 RepID=A0A2K8P5X5_STRLA|nr:hypothetical protein SLAV_01075 [Streptomyces lavendulae subsp. lavendulae]
MQGERVLADTDVKHGIEAAPPQKDERGHGLGLAVVVDEPASAAMCAQCSFQPRHLLR